MASLSTLPNEILKQITQEVSFPDIESWTLTCQRLRWLGFSKLEMHRERKRIYPRMSVGRRFWTQFETLTELLRHLLEKPEKAIYPTNLVIQHDIETAEYEEYKEWRDRDNEDEYRREVKQEIVEMIFELDGKEEVLWEKFAQYQYLGTNGM